MTRPYLNGSIYWLRKKVPDDLRPILGKTEEKKSLGTRDPAEAKVRFARAIAEIEERWRRLRGELTELTPREAYALAGEFHHEFVAAREDNPRLSHQERHALEAGKVVLGLSKPPTKYPDGSPFVPTPKQARDRAYGEKMARDNAALIDAFLIKRGIRLKQPSRKLFDEAVMRAVVMGRQVMVQRMNHNFGPHPDAGRFPVLESPALTSALAKQPETGGHDDATLSIAIAAWVKEKTRKGGSWVGTSAASNELWASRFKELVGDKPLKEYVKADARHFKDALLSLPPNFTHVDGFDGLNFVDAVNKARALGTEPMSTSNVNKILGFVRAFWNWAEAQYDEVTLNPFNKMNLRMKIKSRDQRYPFSPEQLQSILDAPLFTGCQSGKSWLMPGDHIPFDTGIYWVPLIGLYTGARSGEIIQLLVDDIQEDGGILFFNITDEGEGQTLKTDSSIRMIPVHPMLKRLGLEAFVANRRENGSGARLFPELPRAVDGYYSTSYSPRFKRFLKDIGAKTTKHSFHSFRHSFEDACISNGISQEFTNALQGHTSPGMAARYGSGLPWLEKLASELNKLDYSRVDFSKMLAARGIE